MSKFREKGGSVVVYPASADLVFVSARNALESLSFTVEVADERKGILVGDVGISGMSYGERVGIYLKSLDSQTTEVRILSRAKLRTNVFADNWEQEMHAFIQRRLLQLKTAKPE